MLTVGSSGVSALWMVLVLTAGCVGVADEVGPNSGSVVDYIPADGGQFDNQLHFDGCRGGTLVHKMPRAMGTWPQPPGWAAPPSPTMEVKLNVLDCKRIGFGTIEARDAMVILLSQDAYIYPDACRPASNRVTLMKTLIRGWTTSEPLAYAIGSQYAAPFEVGNWSLEWAADGEIAQVTLASRGTDSDQKGSAMWIAVDNVTSENYEDSWFAWFDGNLTHVLYLQNELVRRALQHTTPLVQPAPAWHMTYAGLTPRTLLGGIYPEIQPTARIVTFTGPACSGGLVGENSE